MPSLSLSMLHKFSTYGCAHDFTQYLNYTTTYLIQQKNRDDKARLQFNRFCLQNFGINRLPHNVVGRDVLTLRDKYKLIRRFYNIGLRSLDIPDLSILTLYIPDHYQSFRLRNNLCEYIHPEMLGCVFAINSQTQIAYVLCQEKYYQNNTATLDTLISKINQVTKNTNTCNVMTKFGASFHEYMENVGNIRVTKLSDIVMKGRTLSKTEFEKFCDTVYYIEDDMERLPFIVQEKYGRKKFICKRKAVQAYRGQIDKIKIENGHCIFRDRNGDHHEIIMINPKTEKIWTIRYAKWSDMSVNVHPQLVKETLLNKYNVLYFYNLIHASESIYSI